MVDSQLVTLSHQTCSVMPVIDSLVLFPINMSSIMICLVRPGSGMSILITNTISIL